MHPPRQLLTIVGFAVVGLLALAFSGLFDWITSLLFLLLEFLAELLRPLFKRRRGSVDEPEPALARRSKARGVEAIGGGARRLATFKGLPSRRRLRPRSSRRGEPETPAFTPRARILVPLCADRPGLIAFALEECRNRHAELLVLFLRPFAVVPMGPNPLPDLDEDGPARALFERLAEEASEAGVPYRTRYEVTRDLAGTILEVAQSQKADVLLMEPTRRNRLARTLIGDELQAVVLRLPAHVSVLIHAS